MQQWMTTRMFQCLHMVLFAKLTPSWPLRCGSAPSTACVTSAPTQSATACALPRSSMAFSMIRSRTESLPQKESNGLLWHHDLAHRCHGWPTFVFLRRASYPHWLRHGGRLLHARRCHGHYDTIVVLHRGSLPARRHHVCFCHVFPRNATTSHAIVNVFPRLLLLLATMDFLSSRRATVVRWPSFVCSASCILTSFTTRPLLFCQSCSPLFIAVLFPHRFRDHAKRMYQHWTHRWASNCTLDRALHWNSFVLHSWRRAYERRPSKTCSLQKSGLRLACDKNHNFTQRVGLLCTRKNHCTSKQVTSTSSVFK